jgi:hypothetical protein
MQDLGVQGQRRNTLLPSELETSEHNRKTKQDWRPAAMTTDARIPVRSACISNWAANGSLPRRSAVILSPFEISPGHEGFSRLRHVADVRFWARL